MDYNVCDLPRDDIGYFYLDDNGAAVFPNVESWDEIDAREIGQGEDTTADILQSKRAKKYKADAQKEADKKGFLRDFPVAMINIAKSEFPDAKNRTDALVAYLFCCSQQMNTNSLVTLSLTNAQKDLIRNHQKGVFEDYNVKLNSVLKKLDKLSNEHTFLEMIALYHLYERLGLGDIRGNRYMPDAPKSFDITDGGRLLDFEEHMKEQMKKYKDRIDYRDGKPW